MTCVFFLQTHIFEGYRSEEMCQVCFNMIIYPIIYAQGFVVLSYTIALWLFCEILENSHDLFIHIRQDCFTGTGEFSWMQLR